MPPSCIFIAITGGAAAGKKCVQKALKSSILSLQSGAPSTFHVETLHLHDFLKPSPALPQAGSKFDPERLDAYDLSGLADVIARLRSGEPNVPAPRIDTKTHARLPDRILPTPDVIIAEGLFILSSPEIVSMADVKIFVDLGGDVRLARRVVRDLETRGLPLELVLDHHVKVSKVAYERHILPTKQLADIILPGASIQTGVELVAQGVMDDLRSGRKTGVGTGGLPDVLCEADLTMGVPEYYETV